MRSLVLILSRLRYFAPAWVFASLNIITGTWVLYIPYVKQKLNLSDGQLGIALFCYAFGVFVIIPFVSFLIKTFGVGKCTSLGIILFALAFIFPIQASTYLLFSLSLFIAGIFSGITGTAMNALVSEIEKEDKVSFMSASHGFFSFGGVLGAGLGSLLINVFQFPVWHLFFAVAIVIVTNLMLIKSYFNQQSYVPKNIKSDKKFNYYKPLIGLAFLTIIVLASEGAVENWSKLYLLEVIHVMNAKIAGLGFVFFSITMMLGRFLGDGISVKIGSLKIIMLGFILALIGYGLVLTANQTVVIIGFGLVGSGFSVIIPEIFRLAGNTKGISSSSGISFVSGIGLLGFLSGPVILGFIAQLAGLRMSFVALLLASAIALATVIYIKQNKKSA